MIRGDVFISKIYATMHRWISKKCSDHCSPSSFILNVIILAEFKTLSQFPVVTAIKVLVSDGTFASSKSDLSKICSRMS